MRFFLKRIWVYFTSILASFCYVNRQCQGNLASTWLLTTRLQILLIGRSIQQSSDTNSLLSWGLRERQVVAAFSITSKGKKIVLSQKQTVLMRARGGVKLWIHVEEECGRKLETTILVWMKRGTYRNSRKLGQLFLGNISRFGYSSFGVLNTTMYWAEKLAVNPVKALTNQCVHCFSCFLFIPLHFPVYSYPSPICYLL